MHTEQTGPTILLRRATVTDSDIIWTILQQAIEQRRLDGSTQWQDGYPNPATIQADIEQGYGYVLTAGEAVIAYAAVLLNNEPAYNDIEGKWLTNGDFFVVHRVAVSDTVKGKGIATTLFRLLEPFAVEQEVYSIKVDTNFDNTPMLKILDKLGYTYCGEVFFRGSARKAFEKVLSQ
jgi:GNAT superfamily N-acetyltransferase